MAAAVRKVGDEVKRIAAIFAGFIATGGGVSYIVEGAVRGAGFCMGEFMHAAQ